MSTLNEIVAKYHELEDLLIESGGELTEEVENYLDSNSQDFESKLDGYADFIQYLKGAAGSLKEWEAQVNARRKATENAISRLRDRVLWGMISTGKDKVKTLKHSFSTRNTESWVFADDLTPEKQADIVKSGFAEWTFKPLVSAVKEACGNDPEVAPDYIRVVKKKSITIK